MDDLRRVRLGTVLHQLAEDLVTERRRVALLKRENEVLREQLAALQRRRPPQDEGGRSPIEDSAVAADADQ